MNRVGYLYNEDISKYEYSKEHPMKTQRIKMAHSLISNYGLRSKMRMFISKEATSEEMTAFHHPQYVQYLETWVSPQREGIVEEYSSEQERNRTREDMKLNSIFKINQSEDCPGFEGLYDFCRIAAGGSIDAADLIITGEVDVAINWAGGYHHAKKTEANGFCYVNDIVLCILELLRFHHRVLYLDIDVHHGDGVEQAFYHTNRVMTVSFHQFEKEFFPGTGSLESVGEGPGKFYSVNVPLKRGIDDESYLNLFKKVMSRVMISFMPDVLVIQCGADSLSKDRLGHLNLSMAGHAECLRQMKKYNCPMVLLGGGGYTIENVSRCWAYETSVMLGVDLPNVIPQMDAFRNFYRQDEYKLLFDIKPYVVNENSPQYLDRIVEVVTENMRESQIRPSVGVHVVPKCYMPCEHLDNNVLIEEDEDYAADSGMKRVLRKKI